MATSTREEIKIGQLAIRFLVESEESGGSVAIFEFDVPAGAKVPAAHSHDGYEETIYGLEGVLTWTIASLAGRPPSAGTAEMSHSTSTPSRMPRKRAAKPPSRAWMVSQRAGRSLSLRSEWGTSCGAATNPPEETVIVFASRPISKVSSPSRT